MSPANGGATLSGADASSTDQDAAVTEFGDMPMTGVSGGASGASAAGGDPGGIDSGGASSRSAGGIGGATSTRGGAAGAGGSGTQAGASDTAGTGGSGGSPTPSIYFSEYIEGSSSNKALEIAASLDSVLDGCKVSTYFNGSSEASVIATLSGKLASGQVLTLCSSSLQTTLGATCNQVGRLTFNGDDAVALVCGDRILDLIGQIGVDPGATWGSGDTTTTDHTLRRKCSVTSGDAPSSESFDPSVEWDSFPLDTFDGLGARGC
jgi:hypothetical protein